MDIVFQDLIFGHKNNKVTYIVNGFTHLHTLYIYSKFNVKKQPAYMTFFHTDIQSLVSQIYYNIQAVMTMPVLDHKDKLMSRFREELNTVNC